MEEASASQSKLPPTPALVVAGFLIPGAAQFLQKRKSHALILGLAAILTFMIGMLISGFTAIDPNNHEISFIIQNGMPLFTSGMFYGGIVNDPLIGKAISVQQQTIGIAFTSVAGVCNLLAIFEAILHDPRKKSAPLDALIEGAKE